MGSVTLVVDDEPAVRKYIAAILRKEHLETVEAADGAEGMQIVRTMGAELGLIVSDIQMPNLDGVSFAYAVKAAHPDIPILLISGREDSSPGFAFLRKPFLPNVLLAAVRRLWGVAPA
jgi:CheY-like chemotaxis protein